VSAIALDLISRYLVASLLPACLLLGALIGRAAVRCAATPRNVLAAVAGLILLQSTGGLFQTYLRKIDTGAFMIMNERVQAHLDARFRQSDIVYFGQPALPWWPSARGNRFLGLAANDGGLVARIDDVAAQGRPVYIVTGYPRDYPRWSFVEEIAMPADRYSRWLGLNQPNLTRYVHRLLPPPPR
jgi:hypothetical protein